MTQIHAPVNYNQDQMNRAYQDLMVYAIPVFGEHYRGRKFFKSKQNGLEELLSRLIRITEVLSDPQEQIDYADMEYNTCNLFSLTVTTRINSKKRAYSMYREHVSSFSYSPKIFMSLQSKMNHIINRGYSPLVPLLLSSMDVHTWKSSGANWGTLCSTLKMVNFVNTSWEETRYAKVDIETRKMHILLATLLEEGHVTPSEVLSLMPWALGPQGSTEAFLPAEKLLHQYSRSEAANTVKILSAATMSNTFGFIEFDELESLLTDIPEGTPFSILSKMVITPIGERHFTMELYNRHKHYLRSRENGAMERYHDAESFPWKTMIS